MLWARLTAPLLLALLAAGDGKLAPVATIDLVGVEGRFDHFAADAKSNRLFLAALGNDTLEVVDVRAMKFLHTIRGLKKPAGVAFVPGSNRIVVGCGGDGTCRFYDAGSLQLVGEAKDLDDADNVRYDADAGLIYCGFGAGAIAFIDAKSMKKTVDVKLAAHPESFQLEATGRRMFVNIPEAPGGSHVAVIDRDARKVVAKWPLPPGVAANFPMAQDEPHHRLFVGCRKPAKLVVIDTENGKPVAAIDCVGDTDDVFYDAASSRIYISGGAGAVTVIAQHEADRYEVIETVRTADGARTSFFMPDTKTLFVAVPHRDNQRAQLRAFRQN